MISEDSNKKDTKKVTTKEGVVLETLPNTSFKIRLDEDKREILASLAGKLRMYKIKVLPGDKVRVEITPYDENKGRIVYRLK